MIDWYVFILLKGDAIKPCCQAKDALDDVLHLEVGAQHLRIDVIMLLFQLLRVVGQVPVLEVEALSFLLFGKLHHIVIFLLCRGLVGVYQLIQQLIYILHVARHAIFHHIVGISVVS